jgi:dihydrofolate synthase/folylpolyglutamate synthase
MNLLGDSLEKIAFEKAGIIKQGIPVVIGEVLPATQPIFEQIAKEKDAPLSIASKKRQVMDWDWSKNELVAEVATEHATDHKVYHLELPGIYQTKNLLTVLEACSQLQQRGWKIDDSTIHKGLKSIAYCNRDGKR